ncbi:MAG: endopeptidase La [Bdellovibrio sp. CG10_big_fil_rev_8_21_14_0_10_47_8]|nr:MAG: endopeptidase La [Bdellovibrio sp. CG10_big_fil_rev_8_21_14_0_10_47_8]
MPLPQGLLPIIALKNTVIYPGLTQVIKVGRDRSVAALKKAEKNGFWILAIQQKPKSVDAAKDQGAEPQDLYNTGTICRIDSMKGTAESGYQVVLRGMSRAYIDQIHIEDEAYLQGNCTSLEDINEMSKPTEQALLDSLKTLSKEILHLVPTNTDQMEELVNSIDDLSYLSSLCAGNIDIDLEKKQKILEARNVQERVLYLLQIMQDFKEGLTVQAEIRGKLHQKFGEAQRQTILREQLKAIREELGEGDESSLEDKLRRKIEAAGMPEETQKVAEQELKRLGELGAQSPESHIIRNYLELLTALPWSKSSVEKEIDLDSARNILEEDHYGLEKVKKRIIQHLAVLKLKKQNKGSILLLVGPPGVGKTSLGQSIARSLDRKFARVSLGGVRDDAEVRGHRRTYVGAMPGRIIQGLKRAGENNPVFLLDEIDKMSRAFSGDPASALLEVLDPEQNATFLDHYLDVPFDLSKVFFIATANSLDSIPGPLLDRMEIIDLSGYTTAEKLHIAKKHLIPQQLKEHGIDSQQLTLSDETLLRIITSYTREAGVRDLQRRISTVIRASSERILSSEPKPISVSVPHLDEILGSEKFTYEIAESMHPPGVVTGLAWTPVGGDILFVEATAMPGKGELLITGQLGEVMKESAQIALSLIRSHQADLRCKLDLSKTDFHIHVPAGAVPKDGPSAGVTLLTALASLVSGRAVNPRLAMTGEVTLRGAVTPIGGVKEKVIAAHRAGIEVVFLPKKNEKDLKDIPQEVRQSLQFHFIENISELLSKALGIETWLQGVSYTQSPSPENQKAPYA